MTTAIATLVIGETYLGRWRTLCETSWREYCQRHHYDLVTIDSPLDDSARAAARSPAWQKCLILGHASLVKHERVVWVDADILINPRAPRIEENVPIEKIGVVDENTFPSANSRRAIVQHLAASWEAVEPRIAQNWRSFANPATWHALAGLPSRGSHMLQTGVLVLSQHHKDLLEHTYFSYEDSGGEEMNYEMRPLSFEIQERGLHHLIDSRFNALVGLLVLYREVILRRPLSNAREKVDFLQAQFEKNYFLHFAGQHDLMDLVRGNASGLLQR